MMNRIRQFLCSFLMVGLLGAGLVAQASAVTGSAARNDPAIQTRVVQELAKKKAFHNLQSATEDGIVTLSGTVDLYQQKLDAAKKVKKMADVQGVRNLIEVAGKNLPDSELAAKLDRKIYFDRIGYDVAFNFIDVSVKDGVATLQGATRTEVGRDSALALANTMPGVKDVVNEIKVLPVSGFDDQIRLRALRAIYRDPVLSRYAIDPARPIRIVVDNGHLALYGVVENTMDKQVAGIRANQVFGAFSVQNNLQVAKQS
jgi:hyperosmotically inducible periplasmic protein